MNYKYNEPSYEEVAHSDDPLLSVSPERYDAFLEALQYGIKTAESFLRKQFVIEETVLHQELDRYRKELIEFTWLAVRDDPAELRDVECRGKGTYESVSVNLKFLINGSFLFSRYDELEEAEYTISAEVSSQKQ